jgi:hypothetical protein
MEQNCDAMQLPHCELLPLQMTLSIACASNPKRGHRMSGIGGYPEEMCSD